MLMNKVIGILVVVLSLTVFSGDVEARWGSSGSSANELNEAAVMGGADGHRVRVLFRPERDRKSRDLDWHGYDLGTEDGRDKFDEYYRKNSRRLKTSKEKSNAYRAFELLRTAKAKEVLDRLMKKKGEPVMVVFPYPRNNNNLQAPTNFPTSPLRVLMPHEPRRAHSRLTDDNQLLGLICHEVAHTQDKNQRSRDEYGRDKVHDYDEILRTKEMAFMEGWADYIQCLMCEDFAKELESNALTPLVFRKFTKDGRNYNGQLEYDDYMKVESVIATMFYSISNKKTATDVKIQSAFDATNDTDGDVMDTLVKYTKKNKSDGYRVAALWDFLTGFLASDSVFSKFRYGSARYNSSEREKNRKLWEAVFDNGCSPYEYLAYLTAGTALKHYLPWDGKYVVEISKGLFHKTKEDGSQWDKWTPKDNKLCDPYIEAYVNGYQSPKPFMVAKKQQDTVYHEWRYKQSVTLKPSDKLVFMCWDKDLIDPDFIGKVETKRISDLTLGKKYVYRHHGRIQFLVIYVSKTEHCTWAEPGEGNVSLLNTDAW